MTQIDPGCELFESLCATLQLKAVRVAEAANQGEERPDFHVTGADGSSFLAEVKMIMPSAIEADEIRRVYAGEVFATGGEPGARLRPLIGKANRQLKALGERLPGALVVFNPVFLLRRHTDPYAILTAMRGLDVVDVEIPRDPHVPPRFGDVRSGPKKKMTDAANTSTSAIVCPYQRHEVGWEVQIFHNRYATRPLSIHAIAGERVSHWRISDDERDWDSWQ